MVEELIFKVDGKGQMYIDFETFVSAGVAINVVRKKIKMINQSKNLFFDGIYINRKAKEFVIIYSVKSTKTDSMYQYCVIVPFNSLDYLVLPYDLYLRGAY
jgi:ABC-type phosphate transport system ATPase subunit